MRKTQLFSSFAVVSFISTALFAFPAAAAQKGRAKQPSEPFMSVPSEASSGKRFGFGLASVDQFNLVATSLLGVLELNPDNAVHVYLGVPSTSPFQFSAAGAFKHVVTRNDRAGIHMGAGLSLGSIAANNKNEFLISFGGLAGLEVGFPGAENVSLHFDGGAALQILGDNKDFGIGGLSGLLGLSIIYML